MSEKQSDAAATTELRLSGKRCVVTGAARGIGRAIIEKFEREGAMVIGLDVREPAKPLAQALRASHDGGTWPLIACDVSDLAAVGTAIDAVAQRYGGIDILVNNAGVNAYFDATTMSEAEWDAFFAVDLKAAWLCAKSALPYLGASDRSAIVNVSSIHATLTRSGTFPYAAAKAGLVGLTRSLALDYGPAGIRVNAVAPGFVNTWLVEDWLAAHDNAEDMRTRMHEAHPLRRIAEPTDVANVVAFLASDEARAVTGAVFAVDCGLSARSAI